MKLLRRKLACVALLGTTALAGGQQLPDLNLSPSIGLVRPSALPAMPEPVMAKPVVPPCITSVEPFDVDDYNGPMNRLVARVSNRVESTTVHLPRHASAIRPCAMDAHDKFRAFMQESLDPLNFAGAAWDAAIAQLSWDDAPYQQGAAGYGKRYAAALTDNFTDSFFSTFLYPSLFHQDPRYYRQGEGTFKSRVGHALAHRFVARSDSGEIMPNYSEWMGTITTKALSNLYHPGNPRGFGPTANRVGFSVASDMGWDVLREFWPEVAHKLRLPFRQHPEVIAHALPASRPVKVKKPVISDPLVLTAAL